MNNLKKYHDILGKLSPIPVNLPKLYFLGDTGVGKTTIIRKILGTDEFKFPTTRQTRTTVAITEYVISKSLQFKATVILKNEEEIKEYIYEILHVASYKAYNGKNESKKRIAKFLKQTSDQNFRLYYIISEDILLEIAGHIIKMLPDIEIKIKKLKTEFPDDDETDIFINWALDDLKDKFKEIVDIVFSNINMKVAEICEGHNLSSDSHYYQFSGERELFISKCKKILSSEINSISPVVEYARVQGALLSDWIEDVEMVLIDGQGIGHDTKEASQLLPRHYDHFYETDAIILVEESKKPFVSSGKNAMKSIFERGYGEKFLIVFSKLDEVIPYDIEVPTHEDKIDEVNYSLENVLSAIKNENIDLKLNELNLYYLSNVNDQKLDPNTAEQIISIANKAKELSSFKLDFIKPEYDFEMLSAYLRESTHLFVQLYKTLLMEEPWQRIKAFNLRMKLGIDGFKIFAPIADFEEKINNEVKNFISNPKGWSKEVTERLKLESINQIKREFNQLILNFARKIIIKHPSSDWKEALSYCEQDYGRGTTIMRRSKIEEIFINSVPPDITTDKAKLFKDEIKRLIIEAIENCEKKA